MEKAKLVVLFPVFNGAKTLEKCLQCIADQDFRDFRAIIVENRSTDGSLEIAKAFAAKDPRFEVLENEVHLKADENFLKCFHLGTELGEYFCLRACDDFSTLDYLSRLAAALDADKTKLLGVSDVRRINNGKGRLASPNRDVFNFAQRVRDGNIPRNLSYPSEWVYGIYRSQGSLEILLRRYAEFSYPWTGASYIVTEFVVRDLVAYVEGPEFHFIEGSGSVQRYGAKTFREKFSQRWDYTVGCYRLKDKLPPMSPWTKFLLFRMFWNDARRKTRYKLLGFF